MAPARFARQWADRQWPRLRVFADTAVRLGRTGWRHLGPWWFDAMLAGGLLSVALLAVYLLLAGE